MFFWGVLKQVVVSTCKSSGFWGGLHRARARRGLASQSIPKPEIEPESLGFRVRRRRLPVGEREPP